MSNPVCSACGADLVFARTKTGSHMPLDPERRPGDDDYANQAVSKDHQGVIRTRTLTAHGIPLRPWEWRGVPHFATCPARKPVVLPPNVVRLTPRSHTR